MISVGKKQATFRLMCDPYQLEPLVTIYCLMANRTSGYLESEYFAVFAYQ